MLIQDNRGDKMSPFQMDVKIIQMMEAKRAHTQNGRETLDCNQDKRERKEEEISEKTR